MCSCVILYTFYNVEKITAESHFVNLYYSVMETSNMLSKYKYH